MQVPGRSWTLGKQEAVDAGPAAGAVAGTRRCGTPWRQGRQGLR